MPPGKGSGTRPVWRRRTKLPSPAGKSWAKTARPLPALDLAAATMASWASTHLDAGPARPRHAARPRADLGHRGRHRGRGRRALPVAAHAFKGHAAQAGHRRAPAGRGRQARARPRAAARSGDRRPAAAAAAAGRPAARRRRRRRRPRRGLGWARERAAYRADWPALGTTATVVVTDARALAAARGGRRAGARGDRRRLQPISRRLRARARQCRRRAAVRGRPAAARGDRGRAARRAR